MRPAAGAAGAGPHGFFEGCTGVAMLMEADPALDLKKQMTPQHQERQRILEGLLQISHLVG